MVMVYTAKKLLGEFLQYLSLDNRALEPYYQESVPLCEPSEPEYSGANNDSSTQCEDEIPSKKVQLFLYLQIIYIMHINFM